MCGEKERGEEFSSRDIWDRLEDARGVIWALCFGVGGAALTVALAMVVRLLFGG